MTLRPTKGVAMGTAPDLPSPSGRHATCAWCHEGVDTITELIDRVDGTDHLDSLILRGVA